MQIFFNLIKLRKQSWETDLTSTMEENQNAKERGVPDQATPAPGDEGGVLCNPGWHSPLEIITFIFNI